MLGQTGLQSPKSPWDSDLKTRGLWCRSVPSSTLLKKYFSLISHSAQLAWSSFWTGNLICLARRDGWHLVRPGEMNLFEFWDLLIKKKGLAMMNMPCRHLNSSLSRLSSKRIFHLSQSCLDPVWMDGSNGWAESGDTERLLCRSCAIQPRCRKLMNCFVFVTLLLLVHLGYVNVWSLICLVSKLS